MRQKPTRPRYLYDDIILKKGMFKMIEDYIRLSSKYHKDGKYQVDQLSDFDAYLHTFPFKKNNEIAQWILGK